MNAFEKELERRMQILQTQEAAAPSHNKLSAKQFCWFILITLAICVLGFMVVRI